MKVLEGAIDESDQAFRNCEKLNAISFSIMEVSKASAIGENGSRAKDRKT